MITDQTTTPPSLGWVKFLICGCHERIQKIFSGGGGGDTRRPGRIKPQTNETMHNPIFPQKSRGSGSLVPLSGSVHGLGGLVCVQVSNNNQSSGLLRVVLSQSLPPFKGCLISLVILLLVPPEARH